MGNSVRNQSAKRSRQRSGGVDEGQAKRSLISPIPKGDVVGQSWRQASFENSKNKSSSCDTAEILDSAETHGNGAPAAKQEGKPFAGAEFLEEEVGGCLEDGVGNEKHHERDGVLVAGHSGR